jgi:ferritin
MMLSKKMAEAISRQINMEFSAYYAYLGIAVWFDLKNLPGFANWFYKQSKEEQEHAMKLVKYMVERDGEVSLERIDSPKFSLSSPLSAFKLALSQEEKNTAAIWSLHAVAEAEGDLATMSELKWFIDEQVEEESSANSCLARVMMAGDDNAAILRLDHEFSKRE